LKEQKKKVKVESSKEREVHHKCKEELKEEVWEGQRGGLKSGKFQDGLKGDKYKEWPAKVTLKKGDRY
jgi:hypothetical protein